MSDLRKKFIEWFLSTPDADEELIEQYPDSRFKTAYMEGYFSGWSAQYKQLTTLQAKCGDYEKAHQSNVNECYKVAREHGHFCDFKKRLDAVMQRSKRCLSKHKEQP